jgi:hypothetical protein
MNALMLRDKTYVALFEQAEVLPVIYKAWKGWGPSTSFQPLLSECS